MPFIHVKSLPFEQTTEMSTLVQGLTKDFAKGTGIGLQHVTATWGTLGAGPLRRRWQDLRQATCYVASSVGGFIISRF